MTSALHDNDRWRTRWKIAIAAAAVVAAGTAVAVVVTLMPPKLAPANEAGPYAQKSGQLTAEGWKLWQGQEQDQSLESAIEKFDEAVRLDPKNANAWNGLGWANLNSGDTEAAQAAFEKLIELDPKFPAALNGLGQIALYQRKYDAAETYLLQAAPRAPVAWFGLAKLYLLKGNYEQAQMCAQKLLATDEANSAAEEMLKAAKAKSLRPELREQLEPNPTTAELNRAWKLITHGHQAQAQAIYTRILTENPKDVNALNGMGWSLLNNGDDYAASGYFDRALVVEPNTAGSLNGLARISYAKGDLDGAIRIWKQMVEKIPGFHAGTASLADAYLEKAEYKQALPLLEQWSAAEPQNAEVQTKLNLARRNVKGAATKNSP